MAKVDFGALIQKFINETLSVAGSEELVTDVLCIYKSTNMHKAREDAETITFVMTQHTLDTDILGMATWAATRSQAKVMMEVFRTNPDNE